MALVGRLPHVVVVDGFVFVVLAVLETYSEVELQSQTAVQGHAIAILQTKTEAGLRGLIALATPLYVVGQHGDIGAEMMSRQVVLGVAPGAQVAPEGQVAAIALPVAVARVGLKPRVIPVEGYSELLAQRDLDTDVRHEDGVEQQVALHGPVGGTVQRGVAPFVTRQTGVGFLNERSLDRLCGRHFLGNGNLRSCNQ